jgi:hypothetical protein
MEWHNKLPRPHSFTSHSGNRTRARCRAWGDGYFLETDMLFSAAEAASPQGPLITEHTDVRIKPRLRIATNVYVADSRLQVWQKAGPYTLYCLHTLLGYGDIAYTERQTQAGFRKAEDLDSMMPENRVGFLRDLQGCDQASLGDLERNERLACGST